VVPEVGARLGLDHHVPEDRLRVDPALRHQGLDIGGDVDNLDGLCRGQEDLVMTELHGLDSWMKDARPD
jgi:hypothetical protein